jgi:uncharacterized protein (DUF305 family)
MRTTRRISSAGITAGILTAALAWAPTASAAPAAETHPTATVCPPPASSQAMPAMGHRHACGMHHLRGPQLETTFMAAMIPHHAAAVAMARLELARGTQPQLRTMAEQIIASQSAEIGQMTRWLHAWYGLTPTQARTRVPADMRKMLDSMAADMRQMTARLAAVPAGSGFDRAFMEAMIPHHQMAVIASRTVAGRADHPQLRTSHRGSSPARAQKSVKCVPGCMRGMACEARVVPGLCPDHYRA